MSDNQDFIATLVSLDIITTEDARKLKEKYKGDSYAVMEHLVKGAVIPRDLMGKLWGDSLGIAYVNLGKTLFQHHLVQKLPEAFAKKNHIIPLYQFGRTATVAAKDPLNKAVLQEAERLMAGPVSPVFSFPEDIEDAIEIEYQSSNSLYDFLDKISSNNLFKGTSKITIEQLKTLAGDQSVVEFSRSLMLLAAKENASDIHIEPEEDIVRVRFRVDGVLQERLKLDLTVLPLVVSRLKVQANLDITERRRPQDGRISIGLANRSLDYRFSIVPTIYGERVVMRVLGQIHAREVLDLRDLELSRSNMDHLEKVLDYPNGIFFVSGPTGSGKTTTLYSMLKELNSTGINILTIEDPVEYRLKGISQVQVNAGIELTFASALRSFLRQDPDVMLVGEIRDQETAQVAVQAALTGHLVLTTIHTNDAIQGITRLMDIGIEAFLVAPAMIGSMAQRLVRKLCANCKEQYTLTSEEMEALFIVEGGESVHFHRAKGCEECAFTGYKGRIAIHEIFLLNSEIRRLIAKGAALMDITEAAARNGYRPMRYDGIKKVLRGLTTIEEINRVTIAET